MKRTLKSIINGRANGLIHAYITNRQLRESLQPMVLFDYLEVPLKQFKENGFGWHPHSGIGIITYIIKSDMHHLDSAGNSGKIREGGVQWISAGNGIWHNENYQSLPESDTILMSGIQFWIQLPPGAEDSKVIYMDVQPEDVPSHQNIKVIAGEYKKTKGAFKTPIDLNYFSISLEKGQTFTYSIPTNHDKGLVMPFIGNIDFNGQTLSTTQLGVLDHQGEEVIIQSKDDKCEFILITTPSVDYKMITSRGQIHTNEKSLEQATQRINKIGQELKNDGKI